MHPEYAAERSSTRSKLESVGPKATSAAVVDVLGVLGGASYLNEIRRGILRWRVLCCKRKGLGPYLLQAPPGILAVSSYMGSASLA